MKFSHLFLSFFLLSTLLTFPATAQEVEETITQDTTSIRIEESYYRGTIKSIESTEDAFGTTTLDFAIQITNGNRTGEYIEVITAIPAGNATDRFITGDRVVVIENQGPNGTLFFIADHYRIGWLIALAILFILTAIIFAKKQALYALGGLAVSIVVLAGYIVPQIGSGKNPILVGLAGAVAISVASLYVAHGWNKRTHIALTGMLITITVAAVLAWLSILGAHMIGLGSEEAYNLQITFGDTIDLRGLLLVGVIIGALGVLDDMTTSITAIVSELKKANPSLNAVELYKRTTRVGHEHIASLINTLVLAYAGASLPLLLLISLDNQPLWVTFNSQFLAEELIRTLIGSIALVLAIPITTLIAARAFGKKTT